MSRARRLSAGVVLVVVAVAVLVACRTSDPGPAEEPRWVRAELPVALEPVALLVVDDRLVVAAQAADLPNPRLLTGEGERWREIPIAPVSYYGDRALWVDLVAVGATIHAIAARSGGAHGNPRWSTWRGTLDGVDELPEQPMETFGGWGAGGLAGIAVSDGVPLILGSRAGDEPGLDIELWLPDGENWVEQSSAGTALAATGDVQPVPTDLIAAATGLMITGLTQRLSDGEVRVSAAVWTAPGAAGPWLRIDLPAAGDIASAQTAMCDADGCLVLGSGDAGVLAWRVVDGAATPVELPALAGNDTGPVTPLRWRGATTLVLPDGDRTAVLVADGDGWRELAGPAGTPVAAAVDEDRVWVVTTGPDGAQLWSTG